MSLPIQRIGVLSTVAYTKDVLAKHCACEVFVDQKPPTRFSPINASVCKEWDKKIYYLAIPDTRLAWLNLFLPQCLLAGTTNYKFSSLEILASIQISQVCSNTEAQHSASVPYHLQHAKLQKKTENKQKFFFYRIVQGEGLRRIFDVASVLCKAPAWKAREMTIRT